MTVCCEFWDFASGGGTRTVYAGSFSVRGQHPAMAFCPWCGAKGGLKPASVKAEADVGLTEGRKVAPPDISNSLRATPIFKSAAEDAAVERLARLMAKEVGYDPDMSVTKFGSHARVPFGPCDSFAVHPDHLEPFWVRFVPLARVAIAERAQQDRVTNGPLGPQVNASINEMAELRLGFVRNIAKTGPFPKERDGEYFRGWNNALEMIVGAIDSHRTE